MRVRMGCVVAVLGAWLASGDVEAGTAFSVNVSADDVPTLVEGLQSELYWQEFKSNNQKLMYVAEAGLYVEGVRHQFYLRNLVGYLDDGSLTIEGDVRNYTGRLDAIYTSASKSKGCFNLPLRSPSGNIPFWVKLAPVSTAGGVSFVAVAQGIELNSENFEADSPEHCKGFWFANWFIEWALPYVIDFLLPEVEKAAQSFVPDLVESFDDEVVQSFSIDISLPLLAFGPVPASSLDLTFAPGGIRAKPFGMAIDMSHPLGNWSDLPAVHDDSSVHVPVSFVNAVVDETLTSLSLKGARFDAATVPDLADFFSVPAVGLLFPDAGSRFAKKEPVALVLKEPGTVSLDVTDQGSISLSFSGIEVGVEVSDVDYATVSVSGTLPADVVWNGDRVGVEVSDFSAVEVSGALNDGLAPEPTNDTFNAGLMIQILEQLAAAMEAGEFGSGLEISVPPISVFGIDVKVTGHTVKGKTLVFAVEF